MILKAIIDDQSYEIGVPDSLLNQAEAFYEQLDQDMNRGWQMSREWVEKPDRLQRCQIVADKLLTALESENEKLAMMMSGYLLTRLPGVDSVELDTHGEIQNNRFHLAEREDVERQSSSAAMSNAGLSKLDAMEQAGNDVTKVFKVGRGYRYSTFDHAENLWRDSPLASTEQEASRLRQAAFKDRYEELLRGSGH
ncbi:hypothetical protein CCR95_16745 [Thiocystis minor]|uniref:hypothetical protein n=1 Tax=Thiocystis minor TaxID=61597 RepID=UPI001912411B|nr:hypothetical protein [Thiocystis minor]MBK5965687.1 hypothetical protein [Thiocystis minor]